jgi:predicted membrane GTPase involved in stress response
VGKVVSGVLKGGAKTALIKKGEAAGGFFSVNQVHTYQGLERVPAREAQAGEIGGVVGIEEAFSATP